MLLVIDDEDAGQQLNFVAEQLEGKRSRQEGGIHKNAPAEGQIIRHRTRLAENQGARGIGERQALSGEGDLHVGQRQLGLIDYQRWSAIGNRIRERDLPRSFPGAPVFDALIKNGIDYQRDQKCQDEMLDRIVRFHCKVAIVKSLP